MTAVLSVASELFPLVKTGGLADVAAALPRALAAEGVAVRVLLPGYPAVMRGLAHAEAVHHFPELFGGAARLLAGEAQSLHVLVIEAPHLYDRAGGPYTMPGGGDWPDNAFRFAALGAVAAAVGRGVVPGFSPDVVHAHDWQAGLAAAYLQFGGSPRPGAVMTVHNLAFQGQFPPHLLSSLGLPAAAYSVDGVEYYGSISFLKAGLFFADRITTVSPSYAAEICTEAGGMGLSGLLRTRAGAVTGILNGIDLTDWDPATDHYLAAQYDAADPGGRIANKTALQRRMGLTQDPSLLLFGVVTRLTWQKGMDLLVAALPELLAAQAQLAVLGSGEPALERGLLDAAAAHPGRIGVVLGYDEALAHQIQGGADALLVPSRFEPCGLTQLCALRYGAMPVVARVGGLNDTVIDANEMALAAGVATGVQFAPVTRDGLGQAINRAARLWQDRAEWARIQANGMRCDVGWSRPARRYATLYRTVAASFGR
jgi:starch synthase